MCAVLKAIKINHSFLVRVSGSRLQRKGQGDMYPRFTQGLVAPAYGRLRLDEPSGQSLRHINAEAGERPGEQNKNLIEKFEARRGFAGIIK